MILDLQVHKTGHRGVKVELPILGENHAQLCHVLRPVDVHSPGKELIPTNKLSTILNISSFVDSRLEERKCKLVMKNSKFFEPNKNWCFPSTGES